MAEPEHKLFSSFIKFHFIQRKKNINMSNMDYGDVSEMQDQYYEESSNMFPPGTTEEEIAGKGLTHRTL